MSSRFWGDDDSSSSSDESDDEIQQQPQTKLMRNAFLAGDDDEDEEKRMVRSKEQKFKEEMLTTAQQMSNKVTVSDWAKVEDLYTSLNKQLEKNRNLNKPPRYYLKVAIELEDAINAAWGDRKKLNKTAASSLSKVKAKLRKFNKDTKFLDVPLEDTIAECREDPSLLEEEEEADEDQEATGAADSDASDSEAEVEAPKAKSKAKAKAKKSTEDGDDSDSDFWNDGSEESSDSDSDNEAEGGFRYTAAYFLKSNVVKPQKRERKERDTEKKQKTVQGAGDEDDEDDGFQLVQPTRAKKETVLFKRGDEVTVKAVLEKMDEVLQTRGRKNTSHFDLRGLLRKLLATSRENNLGVGIEAKLMLQIIALHFDEPTSIAGYFKPAHWANCYDDVMQVYRLLHEHDDLRIQMQPDRAEEIEQAPFFLQGDVINYVERLDTEFTKSLRNIDPYTPDYVVRLRDEPVLYNLILLAEQYAMRLNTEDDLSRSRLMRIEHVYFKTSHVPSTIRSPTRQLPSEAEKEDVVPVEPEISDVETLWVTDDAVESDITGVMNRLCTYIYSLQNADRKRLRAMLCHIYHNAIFDRLSRARDLMLMGHLQENINHADPLTQILYNRTMVQLGLCAFRRGEIQEAQHALHDIWSSRVRELLAQGMSYRKDHDKSQEDQKIEKARQTPFHLHINHDLIESVFYTTAMLLEVPFISQQMHDPSRTRMPIRQYRRQLDQFCGQMFTAPPENTRERIMAASLALMHGDWKTCCDHILNLKAWKLMTDREAVCAMLKQKICEEGLRSYLFHASGHYNSLQLAFLAKKFELDSRRVHGIVSRMVYSNELHGSIDEVEGTVVMHKAEPNELQRLAMTFAEKVGQFVENNERLVDVGSGTGGYKDRYNNTSRSYKRFGGVRRYMRPMHDRGERATTLTTGNGTGGLNTMATAQASLAPSTQQAAAPPRTSVWAK